MLRKEVCFLKKSCEHACVVLTSVQFFSEDHPSKMKDTPPLAEDSHSKRTVDYINGLSRPPLPALQFILLCVYIVDSSLGCPFPS